MAQFIHTQSRKHRHLHGKVDLIVFDFDGVLTDNRVLVLEDGREGVLCNRADGLGIEMLRNAGLAILILSTETNPVVSVRASKLKVPVLQGIEKKEKVLKGYCKKAGIALKRVLYVGNDLNDLPAIKSVGFSVCPCDAHSAVRAVCSIRLRTPGGGGVVRELAEEILGLKYQDV